MSNLKITRRQAIATGTVGALGAITNLSFAGVHFNIENKLAIHGGQKTRVDDWPEWPVWNEDADSEVLKMLYSGKWYRGSGDYVSEFEQQYASDTFS